MPQQAGGGGDDRVGELGLASAVLCAAGGGSGVARVGRWLNKIDRMGAAVCTSARKPERGGGAGGGGFVSFLSRCRAESRMLVLAVQNANC